MTGQQTIGFVKDNARIILLLQKKAYKLVNNYSKEQIFIVHSNFESFIMDVRKFFNTGKKRDFSDDSKKQGVDDPKKAEESSASSWGVDHREVFSERLDDSSCRDI